MSQPRNRFSSCCGTRFAPDLYPRVCPTCQNLFWDNPIPVAVVLQQVVAEDGRLGLVLIRRAINPFMGELALPRGFIEIEHWRQAGAREGKEEGIGIIPPDHLTPFTELPYESSTDNTRVILFMLARAVREEDLPAFVPNTEASERVVIYDPCEACFSIHTEAIRRYFAAF